jgi:hypothetical protein
VPTIGSDVRVCIHRAAGDRRQEHERQGHIDIARRIASLLDGEYAGEWSRSPGDGDTLYWVPHDTLDAAEAERIGIGDGDADCFFGGVVPHALVKTKTILHDAIGPAPPAWSHAFAASVRDVVLPGWAAFGVDHVIDAIDRLLPGGRVRLKDPLAAGGRGQVVIASRAEVDAAVARIDRDRAAAGVVIERDVDDPTTYSVGTLRLAGITASYFGVQRSTRDNARRLIYGGSDLHVVRGDLDALGAKARRHGDEIARAVSQAAAIDAAATRHYGVRASRRNYDVVLGGVSGRRVSGVVDQSWRIGGASGAEIAAVQAFRDDPSLDEIETATIELFGGAAAPDGAWVHYDGVDPEAGPILKYTVVKGAAGRAPRR